MDIEQLTKSQIILLTLLVSFVTSIATGIVTVALMEQAPQSITQSVNRIVERTVEKVVPAGQSAATIITREKTVIVKESELIPQAVEKVAPSVARIYLSNSDPSVFLGLGVVLDPSGTIATDVDAVLSIADAIILLSDGSRVRSDVVARDKESGLATLRAATTTTEGKNAAFHPAAISVGNPLLGQTVIAIAGKSTSRIADGIITALEPQEPSLGSTIETNIPADSIAPGGILINTDGEIIGISTSISRTSSGRSFIAASALLKKPAAEKQNAQ